MFVYQERGSNGIAATGMRLFSSIEEVCDFLVRLEYNKTLKLQPNGPNEWYMKSVHQHNSYENMPQTSAWLKRSLHSARVSLLLPGELAPEAKLLKANILWDKMVELQFDKAFDKLIKAWVESRRPTP